MTRNEVCAKCDSTSMEMCLLIRHCPLWVDRHNMAPNNEIMQIFKDAVDREIDNQKNVESE